MALIGVTKLSIHRSLANFYWVGVIFLLLAFGLYAVAPLPEQHRMFRPMKEFLEIASNMQYDMTYGLRFNLKTL